MGTNDNHTDGVFRIIDRETADKRKFIRSSFGIITLLYVVHTCQFYTFWSKSMLYSFFLKIPVAIFLTYPKDDFWWYI